MSRISEDFALCVRPKYLHAKVSATSSFHVYRKKGELKVSGSASPGSTGPSFTNEVELWQYLESAYPGATAALEEADNVAYRACGLRGEMFLKLGEARVRALEEGVNAKIMDIHAQAMTLLDAVKVSKVAPKVTRVSPSNSVTWHEVRVKARLPLAKEPVLLSVRVLPSPFEDDTWSVRLRMPSLSNELSLDVQRRFEELVTHLGYRGITVKDIQNGTYFDL